MSAQRQRHSKRKVKASCVASRVLHLVSGVSVAITVSAVRDKKP